MMRFLVPAALVALSSYQAVRADDVLNDAVSDAFDFAGVQLTALKEETLVRNDMFTDYTNEVGEWRTVKDSGKNITQTVWTSGMVCGMFWLQYAATDDTKWKDYAEDCQIGLEGLELLDDNDLGFQVLNSFGLGYRLVGTPAFKERALVAAKSLYDFRYESLIPAVWSWANPSNQPQWDMAVNVDMIMNMELLLWAAENGGNTTYYQEAAEEHSDTTWKDLVRDDFSTFHVADYEPTTGVLVDQGTYQGWIATSTWSRGQAWAIYGHAMVYRYFNEKRFLERCQLLLGYFDENLPEDNVPYADFDAPADANNPKDSSATAIVTSAAFEIFELTGEPAYLEKAQTYLSSLLFSGEYFNSTATDGWEALLRKSASAWGEGSSGSVTGDYHLLEAMVRYKTMAPSILLRGETMFDTTAYGAGGTMTFSKTYEEEDLVNDIDVSGLRDDAPVMIWFGVTLGNTDHFPFELLIEGDNDGYAAIAVPEPDDEEGWKSGFNMVSFSVDAGTFSEMDEIEQITVVFGATPDGFTEVVIDYLVVGHELETSRTPAAEPIIETMSPTSTPTSAPSTGGFF